MMVVTCNIWRKLLFLHSAPLVYFCCARMNVSHRIKNRCFYRKEEGVGRALFPHLSLTCVLFLRTAVALKMCSSTAKIGRAPRLFSLKSLEWMRFWGVLESFNSRGYHRVEIALVKPLLCEEYSGFFILGSFLESIRTSQRVHLASDPSERHFINNLPLSIRHVGQFCKKK